MPTATITCPHCSQTLTTGKGFPAGRRFRCPACGSAFTAGGPRARPLPEADEPQERRGVGLWLVFAGVVGLALLLLTGAGAALAWRFLPKLNGTAVAAGSKPSGGGALAAA